MHTLNKLKIISLVLYTLTSIVLYYVLEYYNYEIAKSRVKENLLMASSIQEYVSEYQKPVIYKLIEDGTLSKEYFNPAVMSSTYIISHIQSNFKKLKQESSSNVAEHLEYRVACDNPTNLKNKATPYESKILKKFNNSDIESYAEVIEHKGQKSLFYAYAFQKNTQACLRCHGETSTAPKEMYALYGDNGFHEKIGSIRAINAVYAPIVTHESVNIFYLVLNLLSLVVYLVLYIVARHYIIAKEHENRLIKNNAELIELTHTDTLTTLHNRRYFEMISQKEFAFAKSQKMHATFMMLDIDYFKQYNDTYGHLQGDIALQEVAKTLKEICNQERCHVFRLGGEEFGLLAIGLDINESIKKAELICNTIYEKKIRHKHSLVAPYLSVSIGIVSSIVDEDFDSKHFIHTADIMLYKAKDNGRNRYEI